MKNYKNISIQKNYREYLYLKLKTKKNYNNIPSSLFLSFFNFSVLFCLILFLFLFYSIEMVSGQVLINMDTNRPVNLASTDYMYTTIMIEISESGKTIDYYDGHHVTNIKGTIVITNPSDNELYGIRIPFNMDPELNMIETTSTGYLQPGMIQLPILSPHETITIGYQYIGISMNKPDNSNVTILNTAIDRSKIRMYTNINLKLEKSPLENRSGVWRRLVSINIMNPSALVIQAVNIKLIKTDPGIMDINNQSKIWTFSDTMLIPRTMMVADILDKTNVDGEVYWISTDTSVTSFNIIARDLVEYYTEEDVTPQIENELEDAIISQQSPLEMPFDERIHISKHISSTIIIPENIVTVKNLIYNFEDEMKTVMLKDIIPSDFELIEIISDEARIAYTIEDKNISWNEININPQSGKIITYTMRLTNKNATGIQYIKGSIVEYKEGKITAASIPVILQYMPEKKIFLQKKVSILNDYEYLVEIEVRNLGENYVENLILREDISEQNSISEISKEFLRRGIWEIKRINEKDSWKLSYVTNDISSMQNIPLIFGIEQDSVYITLIVDNQIKSSFINKIQKSEIIGLTFLIIVGIIYVISIFRKK